MFVTATYNLVDAIFVGHGVGPEAIGALTLVMPFQMLVMSFGSLLAIGSASVVSRALGSEEFDRVGAATGTALGAAAILGLVTTALGYVFMPAFLEFMSASGELYVPTRDYFALILLVEPLMMVNITSESLIRGEGQAKVAMIVMIAGMLVNIGLDPLFIFAFGWGVRGAAIATIIGRAVTFVLILIYFASGKSSLPVRLRNLIPDWKMLKEIAAIGMSGFVRQISTSLVQTLRNNLLVTYGGGMYVTAFGAVFRSIVFLGMPGMGIAMSLPPIAGYNYGAGKLDRARRAVWVSIAACTIFTMIGFVLTEAAPRLFLKLFTSDESILADGEVIMRVSAFLFISFPAYFIGPSFYQALGKPGRAFVLSLTRPVFGFCIMIVAVRFAGAMGVVVAEPVAMALGAILVIVMLRRDMSRLLQAPSKTT